MRGLRHLALTCALALAIIPVAAAGKTHHKSRAGSQPQPSKAEMARNKALLSFQHDLVSVLAPRADPLPLLGAALLARPLEDQPKYNTFHSLIDRAAQTEGAGPAISWMQLVDCDPKAKACPNDKALDKLVSQAPDNAAVWLLKLGQDTHNLKNDDARADLAKAAAAKSYDDYTGTSMKALASSVGVLPPPAEVIDKARTPAGAAGVQVMIVFGMASAQPQPGLPVTAKLCENAGDDASIKADCLKLGKVLEWGSSPLARSLGLHLREVLADDPAQQEEAKNARRDLVWQVQNFAQLLARAQGDKALAQHLVSLARNGGTEMSLMLAALRDNQIPTEAPADWQPQGAKKSAG